MSASHAAILSHFGTYRFAEAFWNRNRENRAEATRAFLASIAATAESTVIYTVSGTQPGIDVLLWSSIRVTSTLRPAEFLNGRGAAEAAHRSWLEPRGVFWGMTRPSEYSRAKSAQAIDPFAGSRLPYLIVYPFSKSSDWYVSGKDARQAMMNEHMTIGKSYRDVRQLLLYSFGLQDHEFVVVYETEDLDRFSRLVHDLRVTEGRRYTKVDTPVQLGILSDPDGLVEVVSQS